MAAATATAAQAPAATDVNQKTGDAPAATAAAVVAPAGPSVLILGGGGFIGRNLVKYLVDNKLTGKIRVADKTPLGVQNLAEEHKKAFDQKGWVEFVQSDLAKDAFVDKAFKDVKFDYVVNLCGETRFNQKEDDHKLRTLEPAIKCGKAALKNGVKKFVEVSHAQVYDGSSKPVSEKGKLSPWTMVAKYRRKAEEELGKVAGLPLVILRPAITYGPGDTLGLAPRLAVGAVYQKLPAEPMKFLWGKDLKLSTVHVDDVVRAIWLAASDPSFKPGAVYNLSDEQNLDQGTLNTWIGKIFKVKIDFVGSMLSAMAKLQLDAIASDANDKHIPIWHTLVQESKLKDTPVSPYIDKELLGGTDLCIDGKAIAKETAFKAYTVPKITFEQLVAQVEYMQKVGQFPGVAIVKTP